MKDFRDLLDKVYLVYYIVIDTSNELCSKRYYYADIIFKDYNTASSYVIDANKTYEGCREYKVVCVPII